METQWDQRIKKDTVYYLLGNVGNEQSQQYEECCKSGATGRCDYSISQSSTAV